MRLWRLSTQRYATAMDGGYGLRFDGRWNTIGRPVTYCATSPSLCVLEKLVHVDDPALLPKLATVTYEMLDDISVRHHKLADLPDDWLGREILTQRLGDEWLDGMSSVLLLVPSVIVPLDAPDRNVLINHHHPDASKIRIERADPFELDFRLFKAGSGQRT